MEYNKAVEEFRDSEYPMLQGKVYLDHAGSTLYARSTITQFSSNLLSNLYGNPHSDSAPARLSGDAIDAIRLEALQFFNADPEHFDLIFTANATASIKLVAECFKDLTASGCSNGKFVYLYHKDAHTSVVGVRELAGSAHCFASDAEVERWLSGQDGSLNARGARAPTLFAYPGQSNMTGRRLPLTWPSKLRNSLLKAHQNTYTLLDAAALATTAPLDFSDPESAPDFTAFSFYKIFGFPDLGALIVRKSSGHVLSWRWYFGGGTVDLLTVLHEPSVSRKQTLHECLEDGTLPFHNIIALGCAMDVHRKLYGSMKRISRHTLFLANRLYEGMSSLRHFNGEPVCTIYGDVSVLEPYTDSMTQGGTVAFNIVDFMGRCVGHALVEKLANEKNVFLRSGGLCNPGGIASYLEVEPWQFKRMASAGHRCGGKTQVINGTRTGVVRASLGAMSTIADVDTLLDFLDDAFVQRPRNSIAETVAGEWPLHAREDEGYGRNGSRSHAVTLSYPVSLTDAAESLSHPSSSSESLNYVPPMANLPPPVVSRYKNSDLEASYDEIDADKENMALLMNPIPGNNLVVQKFASVETF